MNGVVNTYRRTYTLINGAAGLLLFCLEENLTPVTKHAQNSEFDLFEVPKSTLVAVFEREFVKDAEECVECLNKKYGGKMYFKRDEIVDFSPSETT